MRTHPHPTQNAHPTHLHPHPPVSRELLIEFSNGSNGEAETEEQWTKRNCIIIIIIILSTLDSEFKFSQHTELVFYLSTVNK